MPIARRFTSSRSSSSLLSSLCLGNKGVLSQKLSLIDLLVKKYKHDEAEQLFQSICPTVGASIGQHFRHSMDHVELAALVAHTSIISPSPSPPITTTVHNIIGELHYDLRVRGGTLEKDLNEARKRIVSVNDILDELLIKLDSLSNDNDHHIKEKEKKEEEEGKNITDTYNHAKDTNNGQQPVNAYFVLGGDPNTDGEVQLRSTVGRELGFAAHHAIHHMAMVKIIATHFIGIHSDELPPDFGRAPSTVQHDTLISMDI